MDVALPTRENDRFTPPALPNNNTIKPVLRGVWLGGQSVVIDSISGKLATDMTPEETKKEITATNVHSILHWVDKSNPTGESPVNPANDNQYSHWETSVQNWWNSHSHLYQTNTGVNIPTEYDDVHVEANKPIVSIISPISNSTQSIENPLNITLGYNSQSRYGFKKFDVYLDNQYVGTSSSITYSFIPEQYSIGDTPTHTIKVVVYDTVYNRTEKTVSITLN
jgi:archaellum component FlaF (FlaF/FlaG flagellin family)